MNVMASGSTSSANDEIRVASPPSGGPCPKEYPGFDVELQWVRPISDGTYAATPTYNTGFYFLEGSGVGTVICGYLTRFEEDKENYTGKEVTLASTELQIVYGPSKAEVEGAEAAKRKYEEEAPARQAAKEAAEAQARTAAEAKTRELAEQAPVTFLRVKTVGHPDLNGSEAGHTMIAVATNPYAHVTIIVNHHAGTFHYRAPGKGGAEIRWSCGHPGLRYSYVVTAARGSGALLRRSGHFKMASSAWCAAERKKEKQEVEERKRKEQSPEGKIEHAEEEYCEKVIGGEPGAFVIAAGHIYLNCHYKGVRIVVGEGVV
jgi:hypothetical protein